MICTKLNRQVKREEKKERKRQKKRFFISLLAIKIIWNSAVWILYSWSHFAGSFYFDESNQNIQHNFFFKLFSRHNDKHNFQPQKVFTLRKQQSVFQGPIQKVNLMLKSWKFLNENYSNLSLLVVIVVAPIKDSCKFHTLQMCKTVQSVWYFGVGLWFRITVCLIYAIAQYFGLFFDGIFFFYFYCENCLTRDF